MVEQGSIWRERINKWEAFYSEKRQIYEKITDYYSNEFPTGLITVNMLFSFGRAMVPQLYFKNPTAAVQIARPGNEDIARTLQLVDNALLKAMRTKHTIKKMIIDAYCYGRGVAKLGYNDEDATGVMVSRITGAVPTTEVPIYKMRSLVGPRRPWLVHFYPDDFAFDYQISEMEDSGWQAMRFELSNEQLVGMPELNRARKTPSTDESDPEERIVFWEIWDKASGEFFVIEDDEMVTDRMPISIWPFYHLDFNYTPRNPIPVSDAELILKLQDEYNEMKTQIHEHRRVSILKIMIRKGAMDREAKQKMDSGKVGPIVEVDGNPQEVMSEFKPSIPHDLFTVANTTETDIRDTIGFTRNQLGEYSQTHRTAREAQIVQSALQLRLDERRDMVGDVIGDILTGCNDMIAVHWEPEDVERFAGVSLGWEKIQDVQSEYVVNVVADSAMPVNRQVQQAEAKELYVTLREDPFIDQVKLRARYLSAFETADLTLINPQVIAMQQAAQAQGGTAAPQTAQATTNGMPILPGQTQ